MRTYGVLFMSTRRQAYDVIDVNIFHLKKEANWVRPKLLTQRKSGKTGRDQMGKKYDRRAERPIKTKLRFHLVGN